MTKTVLLTQNKKDLPLNTAVNAKMDITIQVRSKSVFNKLLVACILEVIVWVVLNLSPLIANMEDATFLAAKITIEVVVKTVILFSRKKTTTASLNIVRSTLSKPALSVQMDTL